MFLKADTTGRANKQFAATASTDIFVTVTYTEDTSVQPGTYFIKNPENGKVLDVAASTLTPPPAAGTLIKIRSLHGNTNQQWRIESAGAGMYTLTTISNTGTRLAISSNTDGTPAKTAASNTGDSQKFRIIKNKDGSYRIMPALSATRGLDIYHGSDPDKYARNIELFTYSGGSAGWNQKWTFEKVDVSKLKTGSQGYSWTYFATDRQSGLLILSAAGTEINYTVSVRAISSGSHVNVTTVWGYASGFEELWWKYNASLVGVGCSIQTTFIKVNNVSYGLYYSQILSFPHRYTSQEAAINATYSTFPVVDYQAAIIASGTTSPYRYLDIKIN